MILLIQRYVATTVQLPIHNHQGFNQSRQIKTLQIDISDRRNSPVASVILEEREREGRERKMLHPAYVHSSSPSLLLSLSHVTLHCSAISPLSPLSLPLTHLSHIPLLRYIHTTIGPTRERVEANAGNIE